MASQKSIKSIKFIKLKMKAKLKNYRQSPRKVRLVADLVKGKKVDEAKVLLDFTTKRASKTLKKMIDSAIANASENNSVAANDLYVKNVVVNEGYTLKRIRPRAMGRAFRIRKRTSHIDVILGELRNDQSSNSKLQRKKVKGQKSSPKANQPLAEKVKSASQNSKVGKLIDELRFDQALQEIASEITKLNQFIEENKPWELAKLDQNKLSEVLNHVFSHLSFLATQIYPFMPETAKKMKKQLETLQPEALFPRI